MKKFQILIFGASTTHGNWDELGGWSHRVRSYVINRVINDPENLRGHVFNLGVPGDKTETVLKRIPSETQVRLFYPETCIIIGVGGNDSTVDENEKPTVSDEIFERSQQQLIDVSKKFTDNIIMMGYNPVDENRTTNWHGRNLSYTNKQIGKFNSIVKSLCQKNNIDFVDVFTQLTSGGNHLQYIFDGLHPNTQGHEKIFESVRPYIDKFLNK